jgi:hypothetical protein
MRPIARTDTTAFAIEASAGKKSFISFQDEPGHPEKSIPTGVASRFQKGESA